MNRRVLVAIACLLFSATAHAADKPGITGGGSLRPITHAGVTSPDGRFQMDSSLQRAPVKRQEGGAFSLVAKISAPNDPASCAPVGDTIFRHGFE